MESMDIRTAILHSLDFNLEAPLFSQVELEVTQYLKDYLDKRIQRLEKGDSSRRSKTTKINEIPCEEMVNWSDWQKFWQFSVSLANRIYEYRKMNGAQSGDLLCALIESGTHLFFYVGMLDYRTTLVHHMQQSEQTQLELLEHAATLPSSSSAISFEFLTDLMENDTCLNEKKEKGFSPLSEVLLSEAFELTPKEKIKVAQKIIQEIQPDHDVKELNRKVEFKKKVAEELRDKEEVNLESILEEIYVDDPSMLFDAKEKLQDRGLSEGKMKVVSSPYDSKLRRQKLVTDNGISLTLPLDYMVDPNRIEIITGSDGRISIILKNINHIYDK